MSLRALWPRVGMLLLGTPVLAVAAAAFAFWFYSLLLAPLHLAGDAARARRAHD